MANRWFFVPGLLFARCSTAFSAIFPCLASSSTSTPSMPTSRTSRSCRVSQPPTQALPQSLILSRCRPTQCSHADTTPLGPDSFAKHQVDKSVPVEALVKCKMQDNLEFLQWTKRFWDQYYPGGDYDAVARRKGQGMSAGAAGGAPRAAAAGGARRAAGGTTPSGGPRLGAKAAPASAALQAENTQLKETVVGLERERDFYFSKLRDIELLVQQACEEDPELDKEEGGLIKNIQTILYSTEEGFEIPEGEGEDQETF